MIIKTNNMMKNKCKRRIVLDYLERDQKTRHIDKIINKILKKIRNYSLRMSDQVRYMIIYK